MKPWKVRFRPEADLSGGVLKAALGTVTYWGKGMAELPAELYDEVVTLSSEGDMLAGLGEFTNAIGIYNEAWKLIPEPKASWEASTWLLVAIGDACFLSGKFKSGRDATGFALQCPGGFGNPFIHLRLGQCELELGNVDAAAEHLTRAYALEGKGIFDRDDAKYFDFLKSKIQPPASGNW
nr:tetratricopeptide repeat protein [Dyella sp. ASV24]